MLSPSPRNGRTRRQVDEGLNLVPYIDLLTCMIAFLLITAVWTQVAQLRTSSRTPGDTGAPDLPQTKMVVLVGAQGFNVLVNENRQILPRLDSHYDFPALAAAMKKAKSDHPDKDDVLIASEDQVDFDTLVATMDTLLSAGFPAVSLADAAGL
jgi:biopolymer transport protein ExbD